VSVSGMAISIFSSVRDPPMVFVFEDYSHGISQPEKSFKLSLIFENSIRLARSLSI
jgi:hypothetical protein